MLETISLQKMLIFLLFVVNSISPGFGIASHIRYFSTKAMNDLDEIMIAGSVGGAGGGTHPWSGPHGTTCSNDGHHGHHWHTGTRSAQLVLPSSGTRTNKSRSCEIYHI